MKARAARLILRVALGFVFAYAAIESLVHPNDWVGYMPHLLTRFVHTGLLLKVMSVYELVLASWLLAGKYIRFAAMLSALTLTGITVANLSLFAITFRDVGLVLMALALAFV